EKAQYEGIFRRWDPGRRGVLKGEQAREVFAQSGLAQFELAKIWNLSDINNQGELNLDEFSVAMHLIFRRLAGSSIPESLPLELVPRSSKDFMDSLLDMKEQLMFKRPSAATTTTASVGVSRTRSALQPSVAVSDGGEFEDDAGDSRIYQSAHRRRNNNTNYSRTSSPSIAATDRYHGSQSPTNNTTTAESVDQLRRQVQQRKDDIRQAKADAERRQKERAESRVTGRWRIDDLKREIEDIHRSTTVSSGAQEDDDGSDRGRLLAKRARLMTSINELVQIMPNLVRDYERISGDLAETSKDVARKRDSSNAGPPVSDMEARAARLVAQRMAALTGESFDDLDTTGGSGAGGERVREEIAAADRKHAERRDRVQSVTSGLDHVSKALRDAKATFGAAGSAGGGDARKWEDGVGVVSEEVRDLINRLRFVERQKKSISSAGNGNQQRSSSFESPPPASTSMASAFSPVLPTAPPPETKKSEGPSIAERLAMATSKQERDRILQDIAEERFRERQRALGIPDPAAPPAAVAVESPPAKRPEMQERVFVAAPAAAPPAAPPAAASNPFASQAVDVPTTQYAAPAPARGGVASTFNSRDAEAFGGNSSDDEEEEEDEWDRDDSSDDEDLPPPLDSDLYGPSNNAADDGSSRLRAESASSSVSFDTA
ncbi:actin organization and endocytosis protein, partial [Coemansia aciculifera]